MGVEAAAAVLCPAAAAAASAWPPTVAPVGSPLPALSSAQSARAQRAATESRQATVCPDAGQPSL
eukprot:3170139-Alexandrium_andersonii.AAC.1